MTMDTTELRAAALEAMRLLDRETSSALQQARQVLLGAFSAALPDNARARLGSDPGVQAALTRIATDTERYYSTDEEGALSTTLFEYNDEQPL